MTLESYQYLGVGTVVARIHPQTGIDLTHIKQSGESDGDAGDQYTGLDRFGRVVDQRWVESSSGTSVDRYSYTYDRDGNRLTKGNGVNSSFDDLYTYDGLNQLTGFDQGNGTHTQNFDYDAVGNRDSVTTDGSTQTYTANKQNEITSISGATTPTYDANGNMTTDETGRQFVYDAWNKLKTVKDSSGNILKTYGYDGYGRRVTETVSGTTTDLYYSAQWQVLEEQVGGVTQASYVWSPVYVDAMILRDRDTDANGTLDERLYVVQDANFNVTALVNTSGAVVERYVYDPYGTATVLDASWAVQSGGSNYAWQYLHQGGRLDTTSELYNFRNRDYSPTLGRWVTIDPIRYSAGDVNLYGYAESNPIRNIDPFGLASVTIDVKDWIDKILEKRKLKTLDGFRLPASWRPGDLARALAGITNALIAAPADVAIFLNLNYLKDHYTSVTVSIFNETIVNGKDKTCTFDKDTKNIVAKLSETGDTKQSLDLPTPVVVKALGISVGKIAYNVTFTPVITEVIRNYNGKEIDAAKVNLEMTLSVTLGPIEKTIKETHSLFVIAGEDRNESVPAPVVPLNPKR